MSQATSVQPLILAGGEGNSFWFLGMFTSIKASAESTRGAFMLLEQVVPPGMGSPFHVHEAEDEAFYIIEGEVAFFTQGKKKTVGPGGYVFGPRGIPHGFRVEGTVPARVLLVASPGAGFENFVLEMSEPMTDLKSPPAGPPDMNKMGALAAKYKIQILGHLPE
jgi:quercetin dioxygenase-like cupin family protein